MIESIGAVFALCAGVILGLDLAIGTAKHGAPIMQARPEAKYVTPFQMGILMAIAAWLIYSGAVLV